MLIKHKFKIKNEAELMEILGLHYKLKVGFADAKYPNGQKVAEVAYWNEFGHVNKDGTITPPRPFFRNSVLENKKNWAVIFNKVTKRNGVKVALKKLGMQMQKDIKETIIKFDNPPNAPYTIKKKGFNDPLIDTKKMLNSVSWKVEKL